LDPIANPAKAWLVDRLCKAASTSNLESAIVALNLSAGDPPYDLRVDRDWWSSGGETFATTFSIVAGRRVSTFMLKSAISLGSRPVDAVQSWLHRRDQISRAGVETPQLIFHGNGDVCEEFVAYELRALMISSRAALRAALQEELVRTISALFAAGFRPRSLHDLRSRGTDVVVVDFGFDLGAADRARSLPTLAAIERLLSTFPLSDCRNSSVESLRQALKVSGS
jgi:hypothetical protein